MSTEKLLEQIGECLLLGEGTDLSAESFFGRFKPLAEGIFYRIKRGLRPQRGLSLRGDVLFRVSLQTKLTIFYGAQNTH